MKLKEMNTLQAADALARIAEPAAEIIEDVKVLDLWQKAGKLGKAEPAKQVAFMVREIAPMLLKDHLMATLTVLSIMTGKTVEEIGKQNIFDTYNDIKNSVDADLISFFTPSKEQTKHKGTK
jgi:hypothetical protein